MNIGNQPPTYYEILEVDAHASELEIKKAYRRLALKHHPDRCPPSEQAAATERFKAIGEAYQVLSDAQSRASYDAELRNSLNQAASSSRNPYAGSTAFAHAHHPQQHPSPFPYHDHTQRNHPFVDPFVQFEHLFRKDAFFREAFSDMEEEFALRFQQSNTDASDHVRPQQHSSTRPAQERSSARLQHSKQQSSTEGWIPWLLRQCGIQFTMTTYSTDTRGQVSATNYSSSPRHGQEGTTYTNQQTRTFRDPQGRSVTVRSMEKDGNRLEDVLVEGRLVERRVNGKKLANPHAGSLSHG